MRQSGRYTVIDASALQISPGNAGSLHECEGCEAGAAVQLGADQTLVGVVIRVEQAAYAVEIQTRDARTSELLQARRGVFLGGAREWSSGVSSLIRHMLAERLPELER